jgi:hypothetical protein
MIKVPVFECIWLNPDGPDPFDDWQDTILGKWVTERSSKITMYFSINPNRYLGELLYVAEMTEQDYTYLQLKFGHLLPEKSK